MRVRLDTIISSTGLRFETVVLAKSDEVIASSGEHADLRDAIDAAIRSVSFTIDSVWAPLALKALGILRDGLGGCRGSSS